MLVRFSGHLASLKAMRRRRSAPKDWRAFYPELRRTEWAIRQLCLEGARQVVLGGELDLAAISVDPEPPETFQPPMPRSALAMHRRIEDTARFYTDPERHIRRHAERIRDSDRDHNRDRDWDPNRDPNWDHDRNRMLDSGVAVPVPVAVAIRGPPLAGALCRNTSPAPC